CRHVSRNSVRVPRPPTPKLRPGARLRDMVTTKLLPLLASLMTSTLDAQSITYPVTRKSDVVDDYHGTKVADPYRWLEDVDSPETQGWVEAQNRVRFGYLEQISDRERIRRCRTQWCDYPKYVM